MDSRLDSLFRILPRRTESADTWMGIRQHEKEDGRRKRDHEDEKKEKPEWHDETVVSVAALRQFLETLIGEAPPPPAVAASPPAAPATKSQAAAHAYQAAAGTPSTPTLPASGTVAASSPSLSPSPSPTLSAEETRTIHALLDDLSLLAGRGVTSLVILKTGTFLESLAEAARNALKNS